MTDDNVLTYEHRALLGVFALVSPWNMPIYLLTWKIAPCLAFGCTGIAKPSELTSLSAFRKLASRLNQWWFSLMYLQFSPISLTKQVFLQER